MKRLLNLIMFAAVPAFAGPALNEPLLGVEDNPDRPSLSIMFSHEEAAGNMAHHYKKHTWIQGASESTDRIGLKLDVPVTRSISLSAQIGTISGFEKTEETRDLSGYDYDKGGRFWALSLKVIH